MLNYTYVNFRQIIINILKRRNLFPFEEYKIDRRANNFIHKSNLFYN